MAHTWCVSTTHPLVIQIAEKYNLSKKEAKTILNNARKDNPAIQNDSVSLEFLESQDSFKEALATYTQTLVDTEDALLKKVPGTGREVTSVQDSIREELEEDYSEEEVAEMMERLSEIGRSATISKNNTKGIARILKAFKDTRRLEFLGNWVCKYTSDLMTAIETDASLREEFGIEKRNTRIEYYTDINAVNAIRDEITGTLSERAEAIAAEKPELAEELRAVVKNFDTLLFMYGGRMFRTEGVSVGLDGGYTTTDSDAAAIERNDNSESDEDDEDTGELPTSQFSASEQNKSITSKIVPSIKILLSNLREVDRRGNEIEDHYGYGLQTYVSVPLAVNKLLTLCRGCQTYGEMVKVLEKNKRATPWIGQLLSMLDTTDSRDASGEIEVSSSKKEQLQSMFFMSFRKQFTHFRTTYMSYDENGNIIFVNNDANVGHTEDRIMQSVRSKFRRHAGLDIFKNGILDFSEFDRIQKELVISKGKQEGTVQMEIMRARQEANRIAQEAARTDTKANFKPAYDALATAEKHLQNIMKKFGLNISDQLLDSYLSNSNDEVREGNFYGNYESYGDETFAIRHDRLNKLLKTVQSLNKQFQDWGAAQKEGTTTDTPMTNPFVLKKANSDYPKIRYIVNWYNNLLNQLAEFSPDSIESNARINGKDYYSWNNPSSVGTIVENLTGKDRQKVREYILRKYGKDTSWFMRQESTEEGPLFYSDWLNELFYEDGSSIMAYSEKPSFCGQDYGDQSDISYALSILNDYFSPIRGRKDRAWYRMLIASDKPKFSTIRYKRYSDNSMTETGQWSEENYHSIIARKAVDFFAQELIRSAEVIRFAATGKGTRIKTYDIDPSKKKYKPVLDKIKQGKKVSIDDVLEDGKYLFRGTGASFYLNKFLIDEIEKKTKLGEYVVDRVFNSAKAGKAAVETSIIGEFKKAFHNYMDSIKEDYFSYLDDIGLFDVKTVKGTDEGGDTNHLRYLLGSIMQWRGNDAEEQAAFRTAMYNNPEEVAAFAEKEGIDLEASPEERTFVSEVVQFRKDLEEFVYNNWLAKANMSEIFDVDLAFYGNTVDFQKRNAQVVSSGYTPDPDAKIHGQKVSDGKYRSITIKTTKIKSTHLANIKVALKKVAAGISDKNQRWQVEKGIEDTLSNLKKFDATDGQALTGLTALRKRLAGQGEWSRSDTKEMDEAGFIEDENGNREYIYTDEAIYQRIKRGEVRPEDLLHVFAQPQKPFVYSMTTMDRPGRGRITVPVQHKNSEYALVYMSAFIASQAPDSQMAAIAKFLEETAQDDIQTGIDTVNFDSAVKIGDNSESIDLSGLNAQQTLEALRRAVYGENPQRDAKGRKIYRQGVVTEYDVQDYKIVQQKPEHFKNAFQPMGSQIKILAINNIHDNQDCVLPNGKHINGKELKRRYFAALREKMQGVETDFKKEFGLNIPHRKRLHKLSIALKKAMSTDQKFTVEMRRALSIIERDGIEQFALPLDEPGQQSAIEAMLYSKIRKIYYKEKTRGGIVVQATSWGASEDLSIRFYSSNPEDIEKRNGLCPTLQEFTAEHNYGERSEEMYEKYLEQYQTGYAHFEAEIPMPDHVRAMIANPDGTIDRKYFNKDGSWNMEEIRKVVPESVFDAICYRVPTEAKYSMMVCKIVRFSPEGAGSVAKYPKDLTVFTGSDFDIDTDTIEIRPEAGARNEGVDNELFDLQLAALRSSGSLMETFKPGDFADLQQESYYSSLLDNGFPAEYLDKLSPDELKDLCKETENLDLMNPKTDLILHNQNSDAKDMIAIAAVGVTSHAFISLYNDVDENNPQRNPKEHPENFTRVVFREGNGKNISKSFTVINDSDRDNVTQKYVGGQVILDPMYDMDGALVSTQCSKYVGASADAAKDAAEYRLNITKRTLPIVILMHRLGISSPVARAFISQPVIRQVVRKMNGASAFGSMSIAKACDAVRDDLMRGLSREEAQRLWNDVTHDEGHALVYSELQKSKQDPKSQSLYDKLKMLHILSSLSEVANSVRNLDSFSRYNSSAAMRGSSFIDRFVRRMNLQRLQNNINKDDANILLPEDIVIKEGFPNDEFGKLCSMFPHIGNTILGEEQMTQDIILENMKTYSPTFFQLVQRIIPDGMDSAVSTDVIRSLYTGWKNYLLFVGDQKIADFSDEATARYYTRDFARVFASTLDRLEQNKELKETVLDGNTFLESIGYVHAKNGYDDFEVLSTNINGMSDTVLEQYKRDWEALLNHPETRDLAIRTSIHFLARAAGFSRDTPISAMPLAVKEAIPNYIEAFANADKLLISEDDIERFLVSFMRNNSEDDKIVPTLYSSKRRFTAAFQEGEEGIGRLILNKNSAKLSGWITATKESASISVPVIKLDGQLYLILNSEMQQMKLGDMDVYVVEAIPVSPLGVPNQMMEYVGFDSQESIFRTGESEDMSDSEEPNDFSLDPPFIEPSYFVEEDESGLLADGQKVGTYLDTKPFGGEDIDVDYDKALARDETDRKNAPYLESRTHLKRINKLAQALGLKTSSIQRGYSGTDKTASYIINVNSSDFSTDRHEEVKRLAALSTALGAFPGGMPVVRTYTKDVEASNAVELSFAFNKDSLGRVLSLLDKSNIDFVLNGDANQVQIILEDNPEIADDIEKAKAIFEQMRSEGIASASQLEVNYMIQDVLLNDDIDELLNEIKDEEGTSSVENGTDSSAAAESGRSRRKQIGLGDLADLALRRQEGQKVEDEIRTVFGERKTPLRNSSVSFTSKILSDEVLAEMESDTSLYSEISHFVADRATPRYNESMLMDNLIINTANWIMGNLSQDDLLESLSRSGLTEESGRSIIATIDRTLKQLDIC